MRSRLRLGDRPRSGDKPSFARFVLLSYLLGWAVWIPDLLMSKGSLFSPPVFVSQTLAAATPSLVAFFLVRRSLGKRGIEWILSRYRIWRVGLRWYLAAVLLLPGISLAALAIRALADPTFSIPSESPLRELLAEIGVVGLVLLFPLMIAGLMFSSPLLEEFAWRGFALPRLQQRFGALSASLVLGVLWGGWHLPVFVASGESVSLQLAQMLAQTVLITWVVNSTGGSMAMAMLTHASLVVPVFALRVGPLSWAEVALTWAVALLIIAIFGKENLSRRRRITWMGNAPST